MTRGIGLNGPLDVEGVGVAGTQTLEGSGLSMLAIGLDVVRSSETDLAAMIAK